MYKFISILVIALCVTSIESSSITINTEQNAQDQQWKINFNYKLDDSHLLMSIGMRTILVEIDLYNERVKSMNVINAHWLQGQFKTAMPLQYCCWHNGSEKIPYWLTAFLHVCMSTRLMMTKVLNNCYRTIFVCLIVNLGGYFSKNDNF